MNEANVDKDFEAAVIQLRADHNRAILKFGAIMLLTIMFAGGVFAFSLSVGSAVRAMFGATQLSSPSTIEE